jgi:nucleoside-diphosphate-sugar epimerase
MYVLVTGGLGHIGSWVCHELVHKGKKVIATGRSPHRLNLNYLQDHADKIEFFTADVLDYASIFRLFKQYDDQIEGIIHIAGLMGGPLFATNPHYHIRINTMGTVNFLEAARIFGIKKFVYVSSGSVYGPRDDVPAETDPMSPGDVYGAVKASAELIGLQYANEFGLDFRAGRVYFAYGPGHLPSELYPLYIAVFGCLEGRTKIEMNAGADQMVDFTYIKDIANAMALIYEAPQVKYRQYNITSGVYHKLPELIDIVSRCAGVSVEIKIGPGRLMPRGPSLNSTRLREELGFEPKYTFEKGVKEYAEWIKQMRSESHESH